MFWKPEQGTVPQVVGHENYLLLQVKAVGVGLGAVAGELVGGLHSGLVPEE